MADRRQVEVFTAGCPCCNEAVQLVKRVACPSCEVTVQDMTDGAVAERAKTLGVKYVPAIVVDGKLAGCCANSGISEDALRAVGVDQTRA